MGGGAWWAAVHGVAKSRTRLSDFTFTFHFHALEEEMATHSSVLAWRIPGAVGSGGLPSMGSHRVRHDWSDLAVNLTGKECACNERDMGLIPRSGRSPGEGNESPLQYLAWAIQGIEDWATKTKTKANLTLQISNIKGLKPHFKKKA